MDADLSLRPCICIIDKENQAWLLPATSLNPTKPNYKSKKERLIAQIKKEKNSAVRCIHSFSDITGQNTDQDYKSIVEYYRAIPISDTYVKEFHIAGKHIALPESLHRLVKINFDRYMAAYNKGQYVGFLSFYQYGQEKYQFKGKELRQAVKDKVRQKKLPTALERLTAHFIELGKSREVAEKDAGFFIAAAKKNLADNPPRAAPELTAATVRDKNTKKNSDERGK
jgi:hypothetical protein